MGREGACGEPREAREGRGARARKRAQAERRAEQDIEAHPEGERPAPAVEGRRPTPPLRPEHVGEQDAWPRGRRRRAGGPCEPGSLLEPRAAVAGGLRAAAGVHPHGHEALPHRGSVPRRHDAPHEEHLRAAHQERQRELRAARAQPSGDPGDRHAQAAHDDGEGRHPEHEAVRGDPHRPRHVQRHDPGAHLRLTEATRGPQVARDRGGH
mmetsp:Transcript_32909/g.104197  ORF Transcript_32909/g.104197 Transcript_32909/m.104197 type:complete len:210 (+) Transcript_32909:838-1467(+)